MNKKVLLAVVAVLALVVIGALVWSATKNVEEGERQSESSSQTNEERKAEVLEEAKRFQPDGMTACLTVMTPARHVETGVTYTFPSSCLPEGWVAIDRDQPDRGETEDDSTPVDDASDDAAASPGTTTPGSTGSRDSGTSDDNLDKGSARKKAIEEAENFRPKGACATVMTPAIHEASGATYTFPSSCLPDGWKSLLGQSGTSAR